MTRDELKTIVEGCAKGYYSPTQTLSAVDAYTSGQQVFKCPSCGNDWNLSKHNACECGALLSIKCKCGVNSLPYVSKIRVEKCSRCGNLV